MSDRPVEPSVLEGQALVQHINDMNARVLRGDPPSDEEIRAAVLALRTKRKFANADAPKAKKMKAAKAAPVPLDLNSLFDSPKEESKPDTPSAPSDSKFNFDFLEEDK